MVGNYHEFQSDCLSEIPMSCLHRVATRDRWMLPTRKRFLLAGKCKWRALILCGKCIESPSLISHATAHCHYLVAAVCIYERFV